MSMADIPPAVPNTAPPAPADEGRTFRWILTGFALSCLVVLVMVFVATGNLRQAEAANDSVNHTQSLLLDANELLTQLYAADTTMRAFITTGAGRERSACRAALNEFSDRLAGVQSLTRQDDALQAGMTAIARLAGQRVEFIRQVLLREDAEGRAQAARQLEAEGDWGVLHQIKEKIEVLKLTASEELGRRDRQNYRQAQTTRWTVWTGLSLNFMLLAGMAVLLRQDLAARRARAASLQQENSRLEQAVELRTRDLRRANEQLQDDLLEQAWASQALEHQLSYNQLIINSVREAVFVVTRALHITRANPTVQHLTDRPLEDIINRPLEQIIQLPGEGPGHAINAQLLRAINDGQDLRHQPATLISRTGQAFAVIVSLFPLRDSGKVVGAVIIIDDPLLYQHHHANDHLPPPPPTLIK